MKLIIWGKRINGKWTVCDCRTPADSKMEAAYLEDEAERLRELAKLDAKLVPIMIKRQRLKRLRQYEKENKLH
jgi:hypothetical protein